MKTKAQLLSALSGIEGEYHTRGQNYTLGDKLCVLWNDHILPQMPDDYVGTRTLNQHIKDWNIWRQNGHMQMRFDNIIQCMRNAINKHL